MSKRAFYTGVTPEAYNELKSKLAAEIAAVLAFAAIRNNDKVGLIMFTDGVELFIPPRKGKSHVLRVIREVLYYQPKGRGTDIAAALEYLTRVSRRKTIAFVISDFFDDGKGGAPGFRQSMRIANKYHDIIAITLNDPREAELPDCGLITLEDAERGGRRVVDSSHPQVRADYKARALRRLEARNRLFRSMDVDHIDVSTHEPYAQHLVRFFAGRRRKYR